MIINFHNSGNATFEQDYYDRDPDDNQFSQFRSAKFDQDYYDHDPDDNR